MASLRTASDRCQARFQTGRRALNERRGNRARAFFHQPPAPISPTMYSSRSGPCGSPHSHRMLRIGGRASREDDHFEAFSASSVTAAGCALRLPQFNRNQVPSRVLAREGADRAAMKKLLNRIRPRCEFRIVRRGLRWPSRRSTSPRRACPRAHETLRITLCVREQGPC